MFYIRRLNLKQYFFVCWAGERSWMEVEMNGNKYIAYMHWAFYKHRLLRNGSVALWCQWLRFSLSPTSATVNEMDNAMFFTLFYECIFSFYAAASSPLLRLQWYRLCCFSSNRSLASCEWGKSDVKAYHKYLMFSI